MPPMSFFREQKIKLAQRLLEGQYDRRRIPRPPADALRLQAAAVVDEAGRIARERGQNVLAILKDLVRNLKR
jgi:hypothetical protein